MLVKTKKLLQLVRSKSSFLKENIWVLFTEYLWLFGVFIISVFFSRYYGADALGVFSYGTAIAQIVILGLGSAFGNLIMRDVGTNSRLSDVYLRKILQIRGGIVLATLFTVVIVHYLFVNIANPHNFLFILILIIAKGLDALCDTFYMIYLSLKIYKKYSIVKSIHTISSIFLVMISCLLNYSISVAYILILLNALLYFIFNLYFFRQQRPVIQKIENVPVHINHQVKTPDSITYKYLAKEIWPLLLSVVFFQVGSRLNTIIIFAIMGSISLSVYSSGLMLITCFTAAAPFMGIVLFPVLNRIYLENPERLGKFIMKVTPLVFLIGVVVMGITYLCIPMAIKIMKNMPDYASAIFAIMIFSIPFNYVIGIINSIFIIIKKQKTGMVVTFTIMLANLLFIYLAAQYYDLKGVAIASVVGSIFQVTLFIIVFLISNKKLMIKNIRH